MVSIRPFIQVSRERSADYQVDEDHPSPLFVEPSQDESTFLRAAAPVLASLAAELINEPVCFVLTDHRGVVLQRVGGNSALLKSLDKVHLAPGFCYTEAEVGTNGIGTALEVGAPVLVDGSDHYAGNLRAFACAGSLITHPTTGALLGLVDITTARGNSNPLLLSFANLAAKRIRERVLEVSTELDAALLAVYYAACQHSGGPVLAVSSNVFMMNALVERHFDAHDQTALIGQAKEAIGMMSPTTLMADLPSGLTARLSYQPTLVGDVLAGGVIQIKDHRPASREQRAVALTGLAGTSAVWRRVSHELVDAFAHSRWVVVQGEPGTGKLALIEAAHRHSARPRILAVVDAADVSVDVVEQVSADLDSGADVVIRRAHLLDRQQLDDLSDVFQEAETWSSESDPWVALTTIGGTEQEHSFVHLLHFFSRTVEVPALRHHFEDLPDLVRTLLNRAGAPHLALSKQAMNQLMRVSWPHNVEHLQTTLHSLVRTRRSGVVEVEDLPAECLTTTRRNLSRMESLERDAIVAELAHHGGDKNAAATTLGMSRATIYRKIRDFGIVMPS